tara:strand:- start:212 stop:1174 length:963 start_codon:yes stop_codon:yes gene_type:complete
MSKSMVLNNVMKWTVTFLMVIAMQSFIFAEGDNDKVGSVAFKFLNIQTDARGAALGGLSAQASGAGALFSNPAGLAGTEGRSFTAGLSQWLVETNITNIGFVMPMMGGAVGVSIVSVDYGEIMRSGWAGTTEFVFQPNQGSFEANDMAMQVSYGQNLSDKFSVGGTAKILSQNIDKESISGLAFDIGTQFDVGYRGIKMGAVISNFGPDVESVMTGGGYQGFPSMSLPMTFSFGIIGEAMPGMNAGLNVLKQADMEQEFILNAEYNISPAALRFSFNLNNPQQPLSVGAGVNVSGINADVSVSTTQYLDSVLRMSIGYSF